MGETVRKLEMEFTLAAQTQLTTRAHTHALLHPRRGANACLLCVDGRV